MKNGQSQNRTDDTSIFSAVLYQLSYLAAVWVNITCSLCPVNTPGEQFLYSREIF